MDLLCFHRVTVKEPIIQGKEVETTIVLETVDGKDASFVLRFKYLTETNQKMMPIYRMAAAMPMMNYGLFTKEIKLEFPLAESDLGLLNDLNEVFARDILVNKLARRRTSYVSEQFLEGIDEISEDNLPEMAKLVTSETVPDTSLGQVDRGKCGILSSGGKESLLTYGMLKEMGANVYPVYVNESGGHWRTALPAYRYHMAYEQNTGRVWTNVDRFYTFMLDNLKIIRHDHRRVRADTYPIRLCIFPVYVFALLPLFLESNIGNLLIGSEFDDQRTAPEFNGIPHYYGVYDQTVDFDARMEKWYASRIPGMRQWSAVRPVSGLIVERILVKRYPELAATQRSCHSCHFEGDEIVPCGKCTKCLGILLFLKANGFEPEKMNFRASSIWDFQNNLLKTPLRLDPDEYEHSRLLAGLDGKKHEHAESIHLCPATDPELIPQIFRKQVMKIISEHTNGETELVDGQWAFR